MDYLVKLNEIQLRPVLRQGDSLPPGPDWFVALLRGCLGQLGLSGAIVTDPAKTDGSLSRVFDARLEAVVRVYQKQAHLPVTGVVDAETWARLANEDPEPPLTDARACILKVWRYCCDVVQVRETGGNNCGPQVELILGFAGAPRGTPYCVAFATGGVRCGLALAGQYAPDKLPLLSTSGLYKWAKASGRLITNPADATPGDLFLMPGGKTGWQHTGGIEQVRVEHGTGRVLFTTIEGNTGADPREVRSDVDGDGVFRRTRDATALKLVAVRVV